MKSSTLKLILGGTAAAAVLGGLVYAFSSGSSKKLPAPPQQGGGGGEAPIPEPDPEFNPDDWEGDLPLPTADQVKGSVTDNWGIVPSALRPLLLMAEEVSKIRGSARILGIIAKRESAYSATAHNKSKRERDASFNAYNTYKNDRPELKYGLKAAGWGSGGLFAALGPYYCWTGINSLNEKAPLLAADPETMFFPRCAAFAAICYMQRILSIYDVRDIPDIKVGWASVSYLSAKNRGGEKYNEPRGRFLEDIEKVGIDLDDPTVPDIKQIISDAKNWAGVKAVFDKIVGSVPVRIAANA